MSETVITVEGLSKRYLVAHNADSQGHKRYIALRDIIGRTTLADLLRGRERIEAELQQLIGLPLDGDALQDAAPAGDGGVSGDRIDER